MPLVAQQLLACGESLQAPPITTAKALQATAAMALADVLAANTDQRQLGQEAATAAIGCFQLLLRPGRACLSAVALHGPASLLAYALSAQVQLMQRLFQVAWSAGVSRQLASQFAAPHATACLAAALTAFKALPDEGAAAEPGA